RGQLRPLRADPGGRRPPAGAAFRVPALPGGTVLRWRADGRRAGKRAASARFGAVPEPVRPELSAGPGWPRRREALASSRAISGAVMHPIRERVHGLLASADVRVGGDRPWDMRVHDSRLPARLLAGGSLALGESYMDGWWETSSLDQLIGRLLAAGLDRRAPGWADLRDAAAARLLNLQLGRRAYAVGERHY